MSRILATLPGRAGDITWSLPTCRAMAEAAGEPVDLQITGEFASLVPLLALQPYLGRVWADDGWSMSDSWQAPASTHSGYDLVAQLGYQRWPDLPLPFEIERNAKIALAGKLALPAVDLQMPWLAVPLAPFEPAPLAVGWSDCWFELKIGLMHLLQRRDWDPPLPGTLLAAPSSRWVTEWRLQPVGWLEAAQAIGQAKVFLGDCSALHVLAVALGTPAVVYEPMDARLNPIFWPVGKDGPQVWLVRGNDGERTLDSRHTAELLEQILAK